MAEDSAAASFGKVVVGGAVGFALYLLISGLGLGGRGRGDGRGEEPASPPTPPARPRDDKRLSFVMVAPTKPGGPAGFRLQGNDPKKIYSIDDLVARVKDGGRTDVELRAAGDVIQGPWDDARDRVKRAGLTVWLAEAPPGIPPNVVPAKVGFSSRRNARGHYGRSW